MLDSNKVQPSSVATYIRHVHMAASNLSGGGGGEGVTHLCKTLLLFANQLETMACSRPRPLDDDADFVPREVSLPLVMEALEELLARWPCPQQSPACYKEEHVLRGACDEVLSGALTALFYGNVAPRRTEAVSWLMETAVPRGEECPHPNCMYRDTCPCNHVVDHGEDGLELRFVHHKTAPHSGAQYTVIPEGSVESRILRLWVSLRSELLGLQALSLASPSPSQTLPLFLYPSSLKQVPAKGIATRVQNFMHETVGVPLRPHAARRQMATWGALNMSSSQLPALAEGMGHTMRELARYAGTTSTKRANAARLSSQLALPLAPAPAVSHAPPTLPSEEGSQLSMDSVGPRGPPEGGGHAHVQEDMAEAVARARASMARRRSAGYPRGVPRGYTKPQCGPFSLDQIRGLGKPEKVRLIEFRWGRCPSVLKQHAYLDDLLTRRSPPR